MSLNGWANVCGARKKGNKMTAFGNSMITGLGMGFGFAIAVAVLRAVFHFQFC